MEIETPFLCPLCENDLVISGGEVLCKNEECSYDKTFEEIFIHYAEIRKYPRK
jgi:hypothetical protein